MPNLLEYACYACKWNDNFKNLMKPVIIYGEVFFVVVIVVVVFLTHLPLVPHICVSELGHHLFRWWLVACSAPSHYLNKCWFTINWTTRNTFQWNLNRNFIIFIQQKHLKMSSAKMAAILSRGRWINEKCLWIRDVAMILELVILKCILVIDILSILLLLSVWWMVWCRFGIYFWIWLKFLHY